MKTLLLSFLCVLCLCVGASAQKIHVQGVAGQSQYISSGVKTDLMKTFPNCTVAVYQSGTLSLATIWSNAGGSIVKANPFTASSAAVWDFYATAATTVDIRFSGTGITTPFSLTAVLVPGTGGGGGGSGDFSTSNSVAVDEQLVIFDGTTGKLGKQSTLTAGLVTISNGVISAASASDLPTGIQATKIADGSITNTEFQYLNGVTSNIQAQIDGFAGGGITSLNGLTTTSQTFADVDDTNVTLGIGSATSTHTFTLGWTGTLAKARQNATTVYTDQLNTFGAFAQDYRNADVYVPRRIAAPVTPTASQLYQLTSDTKPYFCFTAVACGEIFVAGLSGPISTSNGGLGADNSAASGVPLLVAGTVSVTGTTGTTTFVRADTPTLVTPILGVASATSYNKVAITAPATSATLTIADGKTLTVSNILTFTGTDSSSVAFGTGGTVTYTIASGTSALGTSAINSATCATAVTSTATGTATTDTVKWSFNGDPTAVTGYIPDTAGMLTIIAYPSSGNVNFKVCNNTVGTITPGAITLNWRVQR